MGSVRVTAGKAPARFIAGVIGAGLGTGVGALITWWVNHR